MLGFEKLHTAAWAPEYVEDVNVKVQVMVRALTSGPWNDIGPEAERLRNAPGSPERLSTGTEAAEEATIEALPASATVQASAVLLGKCVGPLVASLTECDATAKQVATP